MKQPFRRRVASLLVAAAAIVTSFAAAPARAAAPELKLVTTKSEVTIYRRHSDDRVPLDIGVYLASVGGAFELHLARPDYDTPLSLTQWVGGSPVQTIPDDMYTTYGGLTNFYQVKVKHRGNTVLNKTSDFCPSSYDMQRVDDTGPANPTYPNYGCYSGPFTLGNVWGIDRGWAINALNGNGYYYYYGYTYISGHDGRYAVHVQIAPAFQNLFGISAGHSTTLVVVHIVTKKKHCPYPCYGRNGLLGRSEQVKRATGRPLDSVPIDLDPDPSTLPDMIPTPGWAIRAYHRGHQDYIGFANTEWNRGPSSLWVEGFRESDTELMHAFQYFTDSSGTVVGRAPVGDFEFDTRPGHFHWHMDQFVQYSILDQSMNQVVLSHKQSFCIAPTDPMDLTVPNALMNPYSLGFLGSNCGFGESSLWTRETLPVGWGDTYYQGVAGQAFNITHLPNGTYQVSAQVNPTGQLYESDTTNDTAVREIHIHGKPGHRTVDVEPWHGIDA
jgi:Lysyl oxidase